MFYLSSVKEIFILSVNHKQIPSMQMTHKSKHSDSGFKKWIQILTRENFSGATSDHEMKFSASNKEDNNKNRNKKPRSLCPAKKPSTTDWGDQGRGYSSYRHIKTAAAKKYRNYCGIFLLPLNSIQFNNCIKLMQRDKIQCKQSPGREETADASWKCCQYTMNPQWKWWISWGSAFLEVCGWKLAYMFFNATIGSKNYYTICKIHVSDMFPMDWATNSLSPITPWATTGSEW